MAAWLRLAAARVHERRTWLTDLDAAIGDGDHGINLDRGFGLVAERLAAGALGGPGGATLLEAAGRTILGTVGGASGALYGRALSRAGQSLAEAATVPGPRTPCSLARAALQAAADSVAALGRSSTGDKTMLDALFPAVAALEEAERLELPLAEGLRMAAAAAEAGAQATIPLLARRGRASYLGERSIGHLDPGAASSALLLAALADVVARDEASGGGSFTTP